MSDNVYKEDENNYRERKMEEKGNHKAGNNAESPAAGKCNHMLLRFDAISANEAFARMAAAAFMMELDPTIEEMDDVKTAVSEAVTNSIIHGYGYTDEGSVSGTTVNQVEMECTYVGNRLTVAVRDQGVGIEDIEKARQPFYTGRPQLERSGMGFAFMEAFMDEVRVESAVGEGTCVIMTKTVGGGKQDE